MSRRRMIIMHNQGGKDLPNGYKRCEYLESTGTQYIDLGIVATNADKFVLDYLSLKQISDSFECIIASTYSKYYGFNVILEANTNEVKFRAYSQSIYSTNKIIDYNSRNLYILESGKLTIDGKEYRGAPDGKLITDNITLFYRAIDGYSKGRLYSFEMYRDNTLFMNLIPCLNNKSQPCFYDTISKQTFYNKGTGEFLYKVEEI